MSELADGIQQAGSPPAKLWERIREDPLRAPEHVALAAAEYHGPAAAAWADKRRRMYGTDPKKLAQMARRRHATMASVEGAATGVGGFITIDPGPRRAGLDRVAARVLHRRGLRVRPARPDAPGRTARAQRALRRPVRRRAGRSTGIGASVAEKWIGCKLERDEAIGQAARADGRQVRARKKVAGRLIPGFAIAFNSVTNRRDTNALAKRAILFYGGSDGHHAAIERG